MATDTKHPTPPPPPSQTPPHAAPAAPGADTSRHSPYETKPSPLPPVGSRDYVAGQPIDEEEQKKVDGEHEAKLKAAEEAQRKAEAKAAAAAAADTHSKK
jgi:hypothetical protein